MIDIITNDYRMVEIPSGYSFVEMDMGCGKGKFTLELARRYPQRYLIASDVMMGRLRRIDAKVGKLKLENIHLLRAESTQAVEYQIPLHSIDRLHILCPDPWPKDKRKARRLICTAFLCHLPRVLKPNGILHLSTDHLPYFQDWKVMLDAMPFLQPAPGAVDDVLDIKTDFELQWEAEGKVVNHLSYRCMEL